MMNVQPNNGLNQIRRNSVIDNNARVPLNPNQARRDSVPVNFRTSPRLDTPHEVLATSTTQNLVVTRGNEAFGAKHIIQRHHKELSPMLGVPMTPDLTTTNAQRRITEVKVAKQTVRMIDQGNFGQIHDVRPTKEATHLVYRAPMQNVERGIQVIVSTNYYGFGNHVPQTGIPETHPAPVNHKAVITAHPVRNNNVHLNNNINNGLINQPAINNNFAQQFQNNLNRGR